MKYCQKCGKELLDEAVICTGCGCAAESPKMKVEQKVSTFQKNRKQWIIALSIAFVVCLSISILLLILPEQNGTLDMYQFYHTDTYRRVHDTIEWQLTVNAAKAELMPYYIGAGLSGVLAIASLIGNVMLFTNKKKG